ncbi:FMN-binding protein [Candidatus Contubernalis alkaliaceticus]|uniref:FMN-binding protein n=1 Tax=Candidatus Contubernalis alkaliaceticus TaxID=338645 RepID=UPI001F4BED64|nr:FMN-binding protein [Candidatus Contubernalis alkalaceticus]
MRKILLVVLVITLVAVLGFVTFLAVETWRENRSLSVGAVDFNNLNDGTYIGEYGGYAGNLRLRAKKLQVTINSGKITAIQLLEEDHPSEVSEGNMNELINSIITLQSLDVDTISGATVTSKTYLSAVEDALLKALIE